MRTGWYQSGATRAALLAAVAFLVGLTLPDADLAMGIGHRHAATHSVLPAALLLLDRRWRAAACGTAGGCGVHLGADAFPNAMTGYATVKLPFLGALPWAASYGWLAANALAALMIAWFVGHRLFAARARVLLLAGGAGAAFLYLARTDGGWPVLAIAGGGGGWWWWRRARVQRGRTGKSASSVWPGSS